MSAERQPTRREVWAAVSRAAEERRGFDDASEAAWIGTLARLAFPDDLPGEARAKLTAAGNYGSWLARWATFDQEDRGEVEALRSAVGDLLVTVADLHGKLTAQVAALAAAEAES